MNTGELKRFMSMKDLNSKEAGIIAWTEKKLGEYYNKS